MLKNKTLWLTALMVVVMVVPAMAGTVMFQQGANGYASSVDSFIRRDSNRQEWNAGGAADIALLSSGGAVPTKQGMIKYLDIFGAGVDQVPAGQVITSATLSLKVRTDVLGGPQATLFISPILIDIPNYGNSDGAGSAGEVTWKQRVLTTTGWGTLGTELVNGPIADEDYDSAAAIQSPLYSKAAGTVVTTDITSIVSDWYTGATDNYGLLLRPDEDGFNGSFYHSNNFGTVADRPILSITYSAVPEPTSLAMFGMGALATLMLRRRS